MIHIVSCSFRTNGMVYDHRHISGGAIRVTTTESGRDLVRCCFFGMKQEKTARPANDVLSCPSFSKVPPQAVTASDAILDRHMAEARRVAELMNMIEITLSGGLPRQDHP